LDCLEHIRGRSSARVSHALRALFYGAKNVRGSGLPSLGFCGIEILVPASLLLRSYSVISNCLSSMVRPASCIHTSCISGSFQPLEWLVCLLFSVHVMRRSSSTLRDESIFVHADQNSILVSATEWFFSRYISNEKGKGRGQVTHIDFLFRRGGNRRRLFRNNGISFLLSVLFKSCSFSIFCLLGSTQTLGLSNDFLYVN